MGWASDARLVLGPGDRMKVSMMGMPSSDIVAVIELDGSLNLGWLGRFSAAGKSVSELTEVLRDAAKGKVIKRYSAEGDVSLIRVDRDDVFLEVAEYRPVVVSGDVAIPGELAFRPGLTARGAIARAGGARGAFVAGIVETAPAQIVRWQNDYDQAALDQAVAATRLWRLDSEIEDDPDMSPPRPDQVAVDEALLKDLIAEQARIADINRQNDAAERDYLENALEKAHDRIAIMEQQREKAVELLEADEEEEKRIEQLLERGLTPATRMADIRRTTLLSATRLLDLDESLASVRLEIVRLQRTLDEYDDVRRARLLAQREGTFAQELDARRQMEILSNNLSMVSAGGASEAGLRVSAIRNRAGVRETVEIDLDDALLPGDTLLVEMSD